MSNFVKWFMFFTVASPWFLILLHNRSLHLTYEPKRPEYQFVLDEVNVFRGEAKEVALPAKLFVNKYTHVAKYTFYNYLKALDPHYLFFETPEGVFEVPFGGPLFLAYAPFIVAGFFRAFKVKKILLLFVALSALPVAFLASPYDLMPRIPVFIALSALAAFGAPLLRGKYRLVYLFILFLLLFELTRFTHNLTVHYPEMLAIEIYKT